MFKAFDAAPKGLYRDNRRLMALDLEHLYLMKYDTATRDIGALRDELAHERAICYPSGDFLN